MAAPAPLAVEMRGIVKSFGVARVLDRVDFDVRAGEVHALVGGNGAGKSTLMKILEGVHRPDAGEVLIAGEPARLRSSRAADARGVAMVFQEFSLIPTLTVAQNVFLGRERRGRLGLLDDRASVRATRAVFGELGVDLDPRARVADLGPAYWQLTEIAKALSRDARVLILDEPTASLSRAEVDVLFHTIRHLHAHGVAVVYISHRMEETFEIADRVTALRDGKRVLTAAAADLSLPVLVEHVVGRGVALEWRERHVERAGVPLLAVRDLRAGPRVRGVSFDLYAGEILGLAGLLGSGLPELACALYGAGRIEGGEMRVRGRPLRPRTPRDAIAAGVALIPEDRRTQGLVLPHAVRDNLLLPSLRRLGVGGLGGLGRLLGLVDDRAGTTLADLLVARLDIRLRSTRAPTAILSGGNQQKVVLAKWLATEPAILIMDEPTAGVDIGAKAEIIRRTRELADAGKGIIVISSELPELLAASDRILVVKDGRVARELDRRAIASEEELQLAVQGAGMDTDTAGSAVPREGG